VLRSNGSSLLSLCCMTCANRHDLNFSRHLIKQNYVRSSGFYRTVWSFKTGHNGSYVLKLPGFSHNFDVELFEMVRMDALVMERLSSSPRIVNIYGHCATSVATEDMVSR
jgi:hypothetical protein